MTKELSVVEELENYINQNDIISDNKLIFEHLTKTYRVKMPSQRNDHLADDKKRQLYLSLIQKEGELTKNQLKKVLKEKQGVDIEDLEVRREGMNEKIKDYYLMMATKLTGDPVIETLKDKITEAKKEQYELTYQVTNFLSASIEEQCDKIYLETLACQCTEILDPQSSWKPVWNNYDEFLNDEQGVANKAVGYLTYLLLSSRSI